MKKILTMKRRQILVLAILIFLCLMLWVLLFESIVWAAEKDCSQEVKIEVGGRYLVESEIFYSNLSGYYGPQKPFITSLTIKEISNSGKYARVSQMNEEKHYWAKVKDLKIIERLSEGGWKASGELIITPTQGWQETLELQRTPRQ